MARRPELRDLRRGLRAGARRRRWLRYTWNSGTPVSLWTPCVSGFEALGSNAASRLAVRTYGGNVGDLYALEPTGRKEGSIRT